MAEPMQVGGIIGATRVTGHLVVKVIAGPPRASAGRTGRVRRRATQSLPVRAVASGARAGACSLPSPLAGAQRAT